MIEILFVDQKLRCRDSSRSPDVQKYITHLSKLSPIYVEASPRAQSLLNMELSCRCRYASSLNYACHAFLLELEQETECILPPSPSEGAKSQDDESCFSRPSAYPRNVLSLFEETPSVSNFETWPHGRPFAFHFQAHPDGTERMDEDENRRRSG